MSTAVGEFTPRLNGNIFFVLMSTNKQNGAFKEFLRSEIFLSTLTYATEYSEGLCVVSIIPIWIGKASDLLYASGSS